MCFICLCLSDFCLICCCVSGGGKTEAELRKEIESKVRQEADKEAAEKERKLKAEKAEWKAKLCFWTASQVCSVFSFSALLLSLSEF